MKTHKRPCIFYVTLESLIKKWIDLQTIQKMFNNKNR